MWYKDMFNAQNITIVMMMVYFDSFVLSVDKQDRKSNKLPQPQEFFFETFFDRQ